MCVQVPVFVLVSCGWGRCAYDVIMCAGVSTEDPVEQPSSGAGDAAAAAAAVAASSAAAEAAAAEATAAAAAASSSASAMDPLVVVDAIAQCMAFEDKEICLVGNFAILHMIKTAGL